MKYLRNILLFANLLFMLLPTYNTVDRMASQWLYLSIVNLLCLIIVGFTQKDKSLSKKLNSIPFYFFTAFILFAIASIFDAINYIESLVSLSRWMTVFLSIFTISCLISLKDKPLKFVAQIMTLYLFIEVWVSYVQLIEYLDRNSLLDRIGRNILLGFEGNKNINAASIAIKLPFTLYLINYYKNPIIKMSLGFIVFFSYSMVFFIGARSMILALLVSSFLYILNLFYRRENLRGIILITLLGVSIFFSNSFLRTSNNFLYDVESSINYKNSESATARLRYFKQAINGLFDHPLNGVGIGNWKISSIKYDAFEQYKYIVQYNVHNDFLEIFAETGFLGGLSYLLTFISLFAVCIFNYFKHKNYLIIYPFIALIVYFFDASLNFPMMRPIMQVQFAFVFSIILQLSQPYKISWNTTK